MFTQLHIMTRRAVTLTGAALLAAALATFGLSGAAEAAQANQLRIAQNNIGATTHVEVGLNKSLIVDLPVDAAEVIVSQPQVAGTVMNTKRRAVVQGASVGETNIFFMDRNGGRIAVLEVSVTVDSSILVSTLRKVIPGARIDVQSFGDRVVLSGTAGNTDEVNKALAIAAQFAGSAESVANLITVNGAQQVMLKVTVAEVSREAVKQLGVNLNASFAGGLTASLVNTPPLGGASNVITSNALTVGGGVGGFSLEATLRALERRGAMRTLAEPTLTALSGQEAEFLAGGEFPVPVGVDNGTITFEFKQFGVNLKFTPTIKANNIIGLAVDTSVSEPTTEGGFSAGGVTIPATKQRKAKTSVELPTGGTLAIAGLIEDKVRQQFNSLPGIGNVPILGALFRSRDFVRSQTELLILVTPYLASAQDEVRLPTDGMIVSGDAEAIFLGRLEKMYGVGSAGGGQYQGSVGFVLD